MRPVAVCRLVYRITVSKTKTRKLIIFSDKKIMVEKICSDCVRILNSTQIYSRLQSSLKR